MLKLNEVREGDIVLADFEGQKRVGDVLEVSRGDKKARIAHGENEFWYDLHHIYAVPLEHEILAELGFQRTTAEDNLVVYERGPFSLQFVRDRNESFSLLHYRDETRHVHNMDFLHQLQHHYRAMTNFELSWP
jgi:hypothetical protein